MHHFYYRPGIFNLDQMRADAIERTKPLNRFGNLPETSVVHMHPHGEDCIGKEHEITRPGENGPFTVKYTPSQEDASLKGHHDN